VKNPTNNIFLDGAYKAKFDLFDKFNKVDNFKDAEKIYGMYAFSNLEATPIQELANENTDFSKMARQKYVIWITDGKKPTCAACAANHMKVFKLENLPVTHPNCGCGIIGLTNTLCTEENLAKELGEIFDKQQSFAQWVSRIGFYNSEDAIDIIFKYDDLITKYANKFKVRKEIIQSILYRELRCYNFLDMAADAKVIEDEFYQGRLENYGKNPIADFFNPPETPMLARNQATTSTGLGQIQPNTAIDALNLTGYNKENGEKYDKNNSKDVREIWDRLREDADFNIEIIARIISATQDGLFDGSEGIPNKQDLQEKIKAIMTRYNGDGDSAELYGEETYEYYKLFMMNASCGKSDSCEIGI
jgi:hypothetical protein